MKEIRYVGKGMMAAAVAATAAVLMAQTTPTSPPASTPPAKERQVGKEKQAQQAPKLRRVSEITGKMASGTNVVGSDNQKLGDIDHLAIDLNSGKVAFAVISSGGVAGVGGTWRPVPLKAIKFSELNDPAQLNVAKAEFESAPSIDRDSWNKLTENEFRTTVHKHYKIEIDVDRDRDRDRDRDGDRDLSRSTERETTRTTTTTSTTAKANTGTWNLIRSDECIGMKVSNPQDENLGEVNDLVCDLNQAKIAYVVLGFGGFLGMGEKLFAVPWQALNLDQAEKEFVINVDKDRLRDAPGFDRDRWPDMADVRWTQTVHGFYGTQPDWVYGYVGEGNTPPTGRAGDRSRGWEHNSEYNRMFKAGAIENFTCTINSVDRSAPMNNMSEAVVLNCRGNDGQTLAVHLGPAWFMDNQSVQFNNGDQVTVSGCKVSVGGKPAVMATEVKGSNYILVLRHKDGSPTWDATRQSGSELPMDRGDRGRETDRPHTPPGSPNTPPRNPNAPNNPNNPRNPGNP